MKYCKRINSDTAEGQVCILVVVLLPVRPIIDLTLVLNVPMFADRHADTHCLLCFCVEMAVVIIDLLCY